MTNGTQLLHSIKNSNIKILQSFQSIGLCLLANFKLLIEKCFTLKKKNNFHI